MVNKLIYRIRLWFVTRLTRLPNVIRREWSLHDFVDTYSCSGKRILNLGSGSVRLFDNTVNADIQTNSNVDILADAHFLPFKNASFDIIIATALLQYCRIPHQVVEECARVLDTAGLVYVDVPFIQAYCQDTPDLFRYTRDGLTVLFDPKFVVEDCGISIAAPSALAMFVRRAFGTTRNQLLNHSINMLFSILVYPLKTVPPGWTAHSHAGAFYLVGRKR